MTLELPPSATGKKRPCPTPIAKPMTPAQRARRLAALQKEAEEKDRKRAEEFQKKPLHVRNLHWLAVNRPSLQANHKLGCRDCGQSGYKREWCPYCPCNYCKQEGHLVGACQPLQAKIQREEARKAALDPSLEEPRPEIPGLEETDRQILDIDFAQESQFAVEGEEILATKAWENALEQIKKLNLGEAATRIHHRVFWPDLELQYRLLIQKLEKQRLNQLPGSMDIYTNLIKSFGGADKVVKAGMACVEEPVRVMAKGTLVDPELLQNLKKGQNDTDDYKKWPQYSGYLDFLTSVRDEHYWRPYIGQSSQPSKRIPDHICGMKADPPDALHYFIFAISRESRCYNFLRLWTVAFDPTVSAFQEGRRQFLLQNTLEMLFCRVFQSLIGSILEEVFGPCRIDPNESDGIDGEESTYSNLGLNILPPLCQGCLHPRSSGTRSDYRKRLSESADPEIRLWPSACHVRVFRDDRSALGLGDERLDSSAEFNDAIAELKNNSGEQSVRNATTFKKLDMQLLDVGQEFDLLRDKFPGVSFMLPPHGKATARVGVVYHAEQLDQADKESMAEPEPEFPLQLQYMGLSPDTCLCFEPYFGAEDHFDLHKGDRLRPTIAALTTSLIRKTLIKIVLVFGSWTMSLIRRLYQGTLMGPYVLNLGRSKITTYLDLVDQDIKAMFLEFVSLNEQFTNPWSKPAKLVRDVLHFTRTIAETPEIMPSWYTRAATSWLILYYYRCEQMGARQIQASTCPEHIRLFFRQYGIDTSEELEQLESAAESLMKAAAMLIHLALPGKTPKRKGVIYSREDIDAMALVPQPPRKRSRQSFKQLLFENVQQIMLPKIEDQDDVHICQPQLRESIKIASSVYQQQLRGLALQGEVAVPLRWRTLFRWRQFCNQVSGRISSKVGDWHNDLDWDKPVKLKAVLNADLLNRVAEQCVQSDIGYTLGLEVRGISQWDVNLPLSFWLHSTKPNARHWANSVCDWLNGRTSTGLPYRVFQMINLNGERKTTSHRFVRTDEKGEIEDSEVTNARMKEYNVSTKEELKPFLVRFEG